jgi:general stress protein 26
MLARVSDLHSKEKINFYILLYDTQCEFIQMKGTVVLVQHTV